MTLAVAKPNLDMPNSKVKRVTGNRSPRANGGTVYRFATVSIHLQGTEDIPAMPTSRETSSVKMTSLVNP